MSFKSPISHSTTSPNYALLSIPAYVFLSLTPHVYAARIAASYRANNKNPHSTGYMQALEKHIGAARFERFERAEAAHRNNLENAPLFIGTILASVFADKLTATDTGSTMFAGTWLALRVLYNVLYINTEREDLSFVRSLTYFAGTIVSFWQIWKVAVALG